MVLCQMKLLNIELCKSIAQCPFWFGVICPWTDNLPFLDTRLECSSSSSKLSCCKDKHLCILGMSPETIDRSVVSHTHIHLACQVREIYATMTGSEIHPKILNEHNSYGHKRLTHPHKHTEFASKCQCLVNLRRCFKEDGVAFLGKLPFVQGFHLLHLQQSFPSSAGSRTKCGRYVDRDWLHTSILGIQPFWNERFAPKYIKHPLPWLNSSKQWQRKGATKKSWTYASCWTNFNRDGACM